MLLLLIPLLLEGLLLAPAYPTFLPTPVALTMILYHITFASKQLHVSNWMEKDIHRCDLVKYLSQSATGQVAHHPVQAYPIFLWHKATTVRIFLLPS